MEKLYSQPHRRFNPLSGEWVKVSPHRTKRPWQGSRESAVPENRPSYDPGCYLCPGNTRAGGAENPRYTETYSFVNDYSALLADTPLGNIQAGLFQAQAERGICKVICFSPRHDLTLPRMSQGEVEGVVGLWRDEYEELAGHRWIRHIQIFENHGSTMGCSNPHPHGQIWAEDCLPDIPAREDSRQRAYRGEHGSNLLMDYLARELETGERIVCQNDKFAALVPYWAVWPYETMVLPKTQIRDIRECTESQITALADLIRRLGIRYDNLFQTDFPYSMGLHQAPVNSGNMDHWTFHMHYLPPLLRSADVKKFMVGYELLAMPQRDITPEQSAEILRSQEEVHYREHSNHPNNSTPKG